MKNPAYEMSKAVRGTETQSGEMRIYTPDNQMSQAQQDYLEYQKKLAQCVNLSDKLLQKLREDGL